jgi:DNA-binding SARP family transcriptional activator
MYFLRRVFEPAFQEDLTAGYVGQDGETVWLDPELIKSVSVSCRDWIRSMSSTPEATEVLALAEAYQGRFALDFMYEDWSEAYRDSLHASFLRVTEESIRREADSGRFPIAIAIAERLALIEPESDDLQVSLVRLYRLAGYHAAAAEQYAHYRHSAEQLGVEPRPFDDL